MVEGIYLENRKGNPLQGTIHPKIYHKLPGK